MSKSDRYQVRDNHFKKYQKRIDCEEKALKIGESIYFLIMEGIELVFKNTKRNDTRGFFILLPKYAYHFLESFLKQDNNIGRSNNILSGGHIMIQSIPVTPSPFRNLLIVFHEDYPYIGIMPHTFYLKNIEIDDTSRI